MNSLPSEIIEFIAAHLCRKDAKSYSLTAKQFYKGTLNRIWGYARLTKTPTLKLPIVSLQDISHLPIKRFFIGDVLDHDRLRIEDIPSSVQEIYIDDLVQDEHQLMKFQDVRSTVEIYMYADVIKESFFKVPKIFHILRTFKNFKVLTGVSSRSVYLSSVRRGDDILRLPGLLEPGLSLAELTDFESFHFSELSFDQFYEIWDFEKTILIMMLAEMKIDTFYIPRLSSSTFQNILLNRKDILRMSEMNIYEISTEVLENAFQGFHPWVEMKYLKKLQRLIISPGTALNLIYLNHLFNFYAVKFGDFGEKIYVSDIYILQQLIKEKIPCPHKNVWERENIWTLTYFDDITIFLNN